MWVVTISCKFSLSHLTAVSYSFFFLPQLMHGLPTMRNSCSLLLAMVPVYCHVLQNAKLVSFIPNSLSVSFSFLSLPSLLYPTQSRLSFLSLFSSHGLRLLSLFHLSSASSECLCLSILLFLSLSLFLFLSVPLMPPFLCMIILFLFLPPQ